jgi:hypothetical protein
MEDNLKSIETAEPMSITLSPVKELQADVKQIKPHVKRIAPRSRSVATSRHSHENENLIKKLEEQILRLDINLSELKVMQRIPAGDRLYNIAQTNLAKKDARMLQ